jgi:hypothetical protein
MQCENKQLVHFKLKLHPAAVVTNLYLRPANCMGVGGFDVTASNCVTTGQYVRRL